MNFGKGKSGITYKGYGIKALPGKYYILKEGEKVHKASGDVHAARKYIDGLETTPEPEQATQESEQVKNDKPKVDLMGALETQKEKNEKILKMKAAGFEIVTSTLLGDGETMGYTLKWWVDERMRKLGSFEKAWEYYQDRYED